MTTPPSRPLAASDIGHFLLGLGVTGNQFFVNSAALVQNADAGYNGATENFYGWDGTEQFRIETNAGATSYILVRGGIAGSMPVLTTGGSTINPDGSSSPNIGMAIAAQGQSNIWLGNGVGSHVRISDLNNGASFNYIWLSGNGATLPPRLAVEGQGPNISLEIKVKGSGTIICELPTSDPHAVGAWWANSGVVTISAG